MSTYLLINIAIIFFPLILSFDKNLKFYKKVPYVLQSVAFISTAYIVWDVIATKRGDWAFNPEHLIGINILGLPIEEILFFSPSPIRVFLFMKPFAFTSKRRN